MGYSLQRVIRRVGVLKLSITFTAEDDRLIAELYPSQMKRLLGRIGDRHTEGGIRLRGQALQKAEAKASGRHIYKSHWSKEDDQLLLNMWRDLYRWRAIRAAFPGRTAQAIYHRASKVLKLTADQKQGMLTIQEIADRAGFSWAITFRELNAAEVLIHRMNRRANGKRIFWVDEEDAMEAMEAYVKVCAERTTNVRLCQEIGVAYNTLVRACQEACVELPPGKRGTPTYYSPEKVGEIRSAIEAWRARPRPRAERLAAWQTRRVNRAQAHAHV